MKDNPQVATEEEEEQPQGAAATKATQEDEAPANTESTDPATDKEQVIADARPTDEPTTNGDSANPTSLLRKEESNREEDGKGTEQPDTASLPGKATSSFWRVIPTCRLCSNTGPNPSVIAYGNLQFPL